MEEDEEEDRLVLSRLGIQSANQEDIEHDILRKVENDTFCDEGNSDERRPSETHEDTYSSSSITRAKLYSKLRAIEFELDAVASSIDHIKPFESCEDVSDHISSKKECTSNTSDSAQASGDGLTIQQALAVERLKSLKKEKSRLRNEISNFNITAPADNANNAGTSKLLDKLVQEEPQRKQKLKGSQQSSRSINQKAAALYDEDVDFDAALDAASAGFMETERDELVRKGVLTPFHKLKGFERRVQQSGPSDGTNLQGEERNEDLAAASIAKVARSLSEISQARPTTKYLDVKSSPKLDGSALPFRRLSTPLRHAVSPPEDVEQGRQKKRKLKRPLPDKKWRKKLDSEILLEDKREDIVIHDYDEEEHEDSGYSDDNGPSCVTLEGGLKIPDSIYSKLFDYQKVGVQWLWELHCQRAGGIIGDEMGLGKTIQVLSFLAALHFSRMYKPSIVICPVTLLQQWRREAQKWYPNFHVEILHDSANGFSKVAYSKCSDSDCESDENSSDSEFERKRPVKSAKKWDNLINSVLMSESGLLVTSYEQLRILRDKLLGIEWGYAILDEGHRIRNPNADVTLVCKQLQTVHRIIMTGAPIQNKLAELWSLFDFVFPGKLGVLPVFEIEFAVPISIGGYANATPLQVSTAYRCAVVLRDLIMPYLLRRMKADVNAQLPKKTEHVLFCSLTSDQRSLYRAFLASSEVEQIFDGSRNSLYGIDVMRKICNHPDLLEREHAAQHPDYGNPQRSGKMVVMAKVLEVWREQGHRVLVFTQTQQMLDIIEKFINASGYIYRRMDGLTPVKQRMALIDEFNNSSEIFIFILTTKVGGLGTNLTGANRVIIYDPDWNPSTDTQARERAWRIGQTRDVTVYRLITRGTIEEKVYHRQIYKHFLTNKILKNPQQKRFFKARDMRDLFTLQDDEVNCSTETSNIFGQLSNDVNVGILEDCREKLKDMNSIDASKHVTTAVTRDSEVTTSKNKGKSKANEIDVSGEETNVLMSLFDAHGIHSAVNHDVILNANDDDRMRLEDQASLVAQKAAEALRQSRLLRSQDSFSVPTWTGKSGAAGAPSSLRKKFGSAVNTSFLKNAKSSSEGSSSQPPGLQVGASTGRALSSAELIARTQGNREKAEHDGLEHQFRSSTSSNPTVQLQRGSQAKQPKKKTIVQPEVLIRQICSFIQHRGGSTDSGSIVEHFKDRVPSSDLPLFRNLLKEIAFLEKNASGSLWVLKQEYRE